MTALTLVPPPSVPMPSQAGAGDLDRPRHFRLDFERDTRFWWRAQLEQLEQAPGGGLRLVALPGNGRPLADPAGTFGGLTEPTGIAVDPWGHIYLADAGADLVKV